MTFSWQSPTITCPCRAHVSTRPWKEGRDTECFQNCNSK